LEWSGSIFTSRRPQSVALAPEYSCSFFCTASGVVDADAIATAGAAVGVGPVDALLQAVRLTNMHTNTMMRAVGNIFMIS
jgi:hypothetical protein